MQKHSPAAPGPSFLQKFEGRKQTVNRDGLLKLLNAKRHSLAHIPEQQPPAVGSKKQKVRKVQQEEERPRSRPQSPSPQKHSPLAPKRIFLSQELRESKGSRSERVLRGAGVGVEGGEGGQGNRFKLPIIARSHSQSGTIITKHVFTPQAQMVESDRPYRHGKEGSFYSKHSDRAAKQMQLDQYVLRHLEFLDKFQKQFLGNHQTPPPKPRKE